jgi:iron complex transport system substrate-binding protein
MRKAFVSRLRNCLRAALLAPLLGAAPMPGPPQHVVSLNMCADQLVIALADPAQIAGLTEWARDPQLSFYADRAKTLPFTHRSAEEVLNLRPDLVIGAPYRTKDVLKPLAARGVTLLDLPRKDGLDGMEQSIRTVASALGHPERGAALIASIRTDLARVGPPPGRGRTAAYYQRQGYLTGTGTLVDDMMRRVGLVNIAARLGRPALSQIPLEQLALARPDFVVTEDGVRTGEDRSGAMVRHPLLDEAVSPAHHLYIPQALTVCGGPGYPRAVAMLADQIRAADHVRR